LDKLKIQEEGISVNQNIPPTPPQRDKLWTGSREKSRISGYQDISGGKRKEISFRKEDLRTELLIRRGSN
jgi:hypothetical protein